MSEPKEYIVKVYEDRTEWRDKKGLRNRDGKPAIEFTDGTKFWYKDDLLHKEDGPAIEYPNGAKEWWVNGKKFYYKTDFEKYIKEHYREKLIYIPKNNVRIHFSVFCQLYDLKIIIEKTAKTKYNARIENDVGFVALDDINRYGIYGKGTTIGLSLDDLKHKVCGKIIIFNNNKSIRVPELINDISVDNFD